MSADIANTCTPARPGWQGDTAATSGPRVNGLLTLGDVNRKLWDKLQTQRVPRQLWRDGHPATSTSRSTAAPPTRRSAASPTPPQDRTGCSQAVSVNILMSDNSVFRSSSDMRPILSQRFVLCWTCVEILQHHPTQKKRVPLGRLTFNARRSSIVCMPGVGMEP